MIHPCVRAAFYDFSARFESVIPWMYLDIKGFVTTGVGNLIDRIESAERLPWTHSGGIPATRDEIREEWHIVKSHTEFAHLGAGAAKASCVLRLSPPAIRALVDAKLTEMVTHLAGRFDLASWPADAQLAVCSMAWAMGPGFKFPRFEIAVSHRNFMAAAGECAINATGNPGVVPRNKANRAHFERAANVIAQGLLLDAFLEVPS